MKLREIKEILDCEILFGEENLEEEVSSACGCDLMSDVLAFAQVGSLLLTGLINIQSVRTTYIANSKAIVYVRGKRPDEETVHLAKEKGIPLMSTKLRLYDACGKLYLKGLRNASEEAKLTSARKEIV
ncbi:MAG: hypothetical protein AB1756_05615 [Acidobacteriota bacterium]